MIDGWRDLYWNSAGGLHLHARDYAAASGEARLPVFCLHGLTRNARDFELLGPRIAARGRRVLAIDVRGRGHSDRDPRADYRLPAYIDDVVRLAAALGIAQAVFVGTSMGGLITMDLATSAPALVAAAVINDVGPELAPAGLMRIGGYVGKAAAFADWGAAAGYFEAQNAHALPHYRADDWRAMARRQCREEKGGIVADYDPAIAIPFADAPIQYDPWTRWEALAAGRPILLLRGGNSDLLDPAVAARMVAGRANVRFQEVAGVGHAPMLDEPDALSAIETFLQSVP